MVGFPHPLGRLGSGRPSERGRIGRESRKGRLQRAIDNLPRTPFQFHLLAPPEFIRGEVCAVPVPPRTGVRGIRAPPPPGGAILPRSDQRGLSRALSVENWIQEPRTRPMARWQAMLPRQREIRAFHEVFLQAGHTLAPAAGPARRFVAIAARDAQ